jgi:GAF domain-containing protein/anti-sigma regulatory factor (Ser/Thr protein kinase)
MATRKRGMSARGSGTRKRKAAAGSSSRQGTSEVVRLRRQLEDCRRDLKEAHERQTATADILKVISSSPTDIQPVLDAVAVNAARLCGADDVIIRRIEDDTTRIAAHIGSIPVAPGGGVRSVLLRTAIGAVVRERRTLHIPDVTEPRIADTYPDSRDAVRGQWGVRTILHVPLLREDRVVGVIVLRRCEVRPFSDKQIELLETFAAQAVIAIENVRLFNETKEALERQIVTADILKVISSSPTDTQPVFEAIVKSGVHLFGGMNMTLWLVRGDHTESVASTNPLNEGARFVIPLDDANSPAVLAVRRREVVQVADALEEAGLRGRAEQRGFRSVLSVPMLRERSAIGAINVLRATPGSFTDKQVALLKTFADQAVIAIENVRLFNETKEALEQQTATADILRVISGSPADIQPALDAVLESATRLCDAHLGILSLYDGTKLRRVAQRGANAAFAEWIRNHSEPYVPPPASAVGRMIAEPGPIHISDLREAAGYRDRVELSVAIVELGEARTFLAVPLLKQGRLVGVISVYRPEVRPFAQKQVDLVTTFADQAVIAIENVRLFNETKEALEQQTATANVLKLISRTTFELQPVLDTLLRNAAELCDAEHAVYFRTDPGFLRLEAWHNVSDEYVEYRKAHPLPLSQDIIAARAALTREPALEADLSAQVASYDLRVAATLGDLRAALCVPMLREGEAIGVIGVFRHEVRPFSEQNIALLKTFADQAVIAIENVRLFNETKEALEQQTATADILKVISSSPTDVQPVFDAIVKSGAHLFGTSFVSLRLVRGECTELVASTRAVLGPDAAFPFPLADERLPTSRAIRRREVVQIEDVLADPSADEEIRERARSRGWRSGLVAPMLRGDRAIGVMAVNRPAPGQFTEKEIALLKTFADQAVIAIENVRLFKELQARNGELTEALEQQTATAEILKVISSSPTDINPVFEAILGNALRLCSAHMGQLYLYDGERFHNVAHQGATPAYVKFVAERGPFRPVPGAIWERVVVERRPVELADLKDSSQYKNRFPGVVALVELNRARAHVAVPMLKDGRVVGVISVYRPEPRPFLQKQIDLLATFADQAVIAIENVRLFKELQARNAEVTEALEQQTATADILRVISSSPTDVQPVFEAIVKSGLHLFGGQDVTLRLVKGDRLETAASTLYPESNSVPLDDPSRPAVRAIQRREVVQIPDILAAEKWVGPGPRKRAPARGWRAIMSAPMLREGQAIGTINVMRAAPGAFSDKQVALLKTFADQAVIAIENVRLFKELQARNVEVTEALEQQTATADILKVISSSPTDTQPVFDAIVRSGRQLFGDVHVTLRLVNGDRTEIMATTESHGNRLPTPLDDDSRPSARSVLHREVVHVTDLLTEEWIREETRERARSRGNRAMVYAPLVRDNVAIGAIGVHRAAPGPFSAKQIALLETFADQAVIAIENVRLFKELQARNAEVTEALEQQTVTADILKVISSSPTDTRPVFDSILSSAIRLCEAYRGALHLYDGDILTLVAEHGVSAAFADFRKKQVQPGPLSGLGQCVAGKCVIHIADLAQTSGYAALDPLVTASVDLDGTRTYLAVPLLREGDLVGAMSFRRQEVRPFTDKQIALLKTFADQAVIAIENVRLFKELQARNAEVTEALEQQTVTAEILKAISSSPTDTQPVFDAIVKTGVHLFGGMNVVLRLVNGDGLEYAASTLPPGDDDSLPMEISDGYPSGRSVLRREVIQIQDVFADGGLDQRVRRRAEHLGYRAIMAMPMVRDNRVVGAITVTRGAPGPFTDKQIALLQTFTDQAVIAIENVRLFKELQARNTEVSEALEQQTATAEVLRVISRSTFDLETVLQTLMDNAAMLCRAHRSVMFRRDGDVYRLVAMYNTTPELREHLLSYPIAPDRATISGRSIVEKRPVHVHDVLADREYQRGEAARLGNYRTVLSVPLLREGEPIGTIALTRDVVEPFSDQEIALVTTFADQAVIAIENVRLFREIQEKSQQLEIANKHKSEFLANMSHELRTPLNSVIGFSDLLLERMYGELNAKQENYIRNIQSSGKHLLSLINDILDLSKIEAGRMELDVASVHIPSALQNAMMLMRERAQRQGIALACNVDPRVADVPADERKLKQIVLNLLSNAVKFTPQGGRVEVDARLANGHLEVAVRDTGVGIAPENQRAVFEEFRQVGRSGSGAQEGTGLGLALSRRFAELHGGTIRLESVPGAGSTFTLSIPVLQ